MGHYDDFYEHQEQQASKARAERRSKMTPEQLYAEDMSVKLGGALQYNSHGKILFDAINEMIERKMQQILPVVLEREAERLRAIPGGAMNTTIDRQIAEAFEGLSGRITEDSRFDV